ncbi:MAG: hypothetical protein KBC95_03830 [Candidatus Peribacteraceae bacterium]|nr:hypothetical protein [Candidatus Peribacteraceae bacterium]
MLSLSAFAESDRDAVFREAAAFIAAEGFTVVDHDPSRPWGGFFVIDEAQAPAFAERFFAGEGVEADGGQKLSPKILLVAPGKRLSWQYHHRRAEIWRVLDGEVAVVQSPTDDEAVPLARTSGDVVRLAQGERHRLVGRDHWGMVAEIWRHTDPAAPSDESDIVRLQDDFGRGA